MTELTIALIIAALMAAAAFINWLGRRRATKELNEVRISLKEAETEKRRLMQDHLHGTRERGVSENTVLALAGEISRMENNIVYMGEVPGRKQLQKGIVRMKTYLQAENYTLVPLLGSTYSDGMMVSAVFVHDDRIPKGSAKIISVQTPQVNYCGKMIQSAKVTVGQNME